MVAQEFGEINVRRVGGQLEVDFTILMEPQGSGAEGWQTGVALDASASMKSWYGRAVEGKLPAEVEADYSRRGWLHEKVVDGRRVQSFHVDARREALAKGYLRTTKNQIEPLARQFIGYLAGNLDADGGTTVLYWACGDGAAFEVAGDFSAEQCATLAIAGPKQTPFGTGTRLAPALHYFVDRFRDAARGMYVFLTDGKLDDLEAVKQYTTKLARQIAAGKQNSVKCVLIGVGDQIDEGQMEQLDDLDTGTEVDIWDHKIAKEMRGLVEIFAEVVDENQIVAPTAHIYDARGKVVQAFTDGLPAKTSFTMSAASEWFELEVGGERIRQSVVAPKS
jgi:hypothetical protein